MNAGTALPPETNTCARRGLLAAWRDAARGRQHSRVTWPCRGRRLRLLEEPPVEEPHRERHAARPRRDQGEGGIGY